MGKGIVKIKSKKILYLKGLQFNLPDDFKGDIFEALEEVLKYHKTNEAINNHEESIPKTNEEITQLWDLDNCRLTLTGNVGEYKDGKWTMGKIQ